MKVVLTRAGGVLLVLGEQGELAVAERYLARATTISSARGSAGRAGQEQARGVGAEVGPAEDWVALMNLYSERWTSPARAADSLVRRCAKGTGGQPNIICFRV